MRRAPGLLLLLVFSASCSFRASCGNSSKLNVAKLKTQIEENFEAEAGVTVTSVTCPGSVDMRAGDIFECTVAVDGADFVFVVTQKDDKGNVNWKIRDGVVVSKKVEALIGEGLAEKFGNAPKSVTCDGVAIRSSTPGTTFECIATDPADKRWRIGVKITDDVGGVDFNIAGPATP